MLKADIRKTRHFLNPKIKKAAFLLLFNKTFGADP